MFATRIFHRSQSTITLHFYIVGNHTASWFQVMNSSSSCKIEPELWFSNTYYYILLIIVQLIAPGVGNHSKQNWSFFEFEHKGSLTPWLHINKRFRINQPQFENPGTRRMNTAITKRIDHDIHDGQFVLSHGFGDYSLSAFAQRAGSNHVNVLNAWKTMLYNTGFPTARELSHVCWSENWNTSW